MQVADAWRNLGRLGAVNRNDLHVIRAKGDQHRTLCKGTKAAVRRQTFKLREDGGTVISGDAHAPSDKPQRNRGDRLLTVPVLRSRARPPAFQSRQS